MKTKVWRVIAAYQIAAGAWTLFALVRTATPGMAWTSRVPLLLLGLTSLVVGLLLWRERPWGHTLSLTLQLLQTLGISITGFAFALRLGIGLDFAMYARRAAPWPPILFLWSLGSNDEPWRLSLNVVALAATIALLIARPAEDAEITAPALRGAA